MVRWGACSASVRFGTLRASVGAAGHAVGAARFETVAVVFPIPGTFPVEKSGGKPRRLRPVLERFSIPNGSLRLAIRPLRAAAGHAVAVSEDGRITDAAAELIAVGSRDSRVRL